MVLGVYVYTLYRWWFRHLTALAARYDVPERRKRAARKFVVVLFLIGVPALAAVVGCLAAAPKLGVFIVIAFFCSIAPAMLWWFRQMPSLYALGYGRQIRK